MSETEKSISAKRKKRGVIRASITRLKTKVGELEHQVDHPDTPSHSRRVLQRLETLSSEFMEIHYGIVELLEEEEDLSREQAILDEHEDDVTRLSVALDHILASCASKSASTTDSNSKKLATRKLSRLRGKIESMSEAMAVIDEDSDGETVMDYHLVRQYEDDLKDYKRELGEVQRELMALDLDEADEICITSSALEKLIFTISLKIRKILQDANTAVSRSSDGITTSLKLPKLVVPKFDGNILNWRSFWEQFSISIHERKGLAEAEKLVYLRNAVSEGSAKHIIEGLSRSGECYSEAIESLCARYDRPRLIHQTHVKTIVEYSPLKDGSGKELRRLHDTIQQHLRALKVMGYEPSGPFITAILELKLDSNTAFEWQRHSQEHIEVPSYLDLLEFIRLRAQASETISDTGLPHGTRSRNEHSRANRKGSYVNSKPITSYAVSAIEQVNSSCLVCKHEKHPLYACSRFRALPHSDKMSIIRSNNLCTNCLRSGHFVKECKSLHRCKVCQRSHHTVMHTDSKGESESNSESKPKDTPTSLPNPAQASLMSSVTSHAAFGLGRDVLLMTCQILVKSPTGITIEARGILDSASSSSFVSERLAQVLKLPQSTCNATISGIAGISHTSSIQSIATFDIASIHSPNKTLNVSAIVVPRITLDLPAVPVSFDPHWTHITDIKLADPKFGIPGRIDLLLGVDIFASVVHQGRRYGPPNSPIAFETEFGWVLAGNTGSTNITTNHVVAHHSSLLTTNCDDILKRFWEVEENVSANEPLTLEEKQVTQHFNAGHYRTSSGSFVVPLPQKSMILGESRSKALRRFLQLERSLIYKNQSAEFNSVMEEYFELDHAEPVPISDLDKPPEQVFYLPMHTVRKDSSTTTKLRIVFDASAKTSNGMSLNDKLLVGPTVHSSLIDVLLRFRLHRIALIADVSKMYRAIKLIESDKDLHRFLWRRNPNDDIVDYRMTRVTFGVSASSFAANMAIKQNAIDYTSEYPLAAKAVHDSFYVDDALTGADSVEEAIKLQDQLQNLFSKGGFLLRKWSSSNPNVLKHLAPELLNTPSSHPIPDMSEYTKTLGIQWNSVLDHFRLSVAELPPLKIVTKRMLVSDIAKTFDVLGWFSPAIIKVKILLQRVWERNVGWDDTVPQPIQEEWLQWRLELKLLSTKTIPRCYFPKDFKVGSMELHGFCDASEAAYAAVVYVRTIDQQGKVHVSLAIAKTRVAPIKRLSIPRLELCGAHMLANLLEHMKSLFQIPLSSLYAWTDSTIVLSWLDGNPRRFKTYVGNRVSDIIDHIPSYRWRHVKGVENPADCGSRGLLPSELLDHHLWWNGPEWLMEDISQWPPSVPVSHSEDKSEERDICLTATVHTTEPIIPYTRYSSFMKLKRISAWIMRFVCKCRNKTLPHTPYLSVDEISLAERYWLSLAQREHFAHEIESLTSNQAIHHASILRALVPFLDKEGLLRVGGRQRLSHKSYGIIHPLIIHGKHPLAELIVRSEHLRLLHAGFTLVCASLFKRFHLVRGRTIVRSIIRSCVVCRKHSAKVESQAMGDLPLERITPDRPFEKVGVDYAGPFYVKYGYVRKPTIVKTYVSVFVSLSVKAVHLELVSDLTSDAFIACLRRFVGRRGKPLVIMSDNGTNFVGANRELREFADFLRHQKLQKSVSEFCSAENISWRFIPERAPHFGGLWEAAVRSMKKHLKRVIGDHKLTFEELSTVLVQVEACLNSRPLAPLPDAEDCVEALTPGHFLIGRSLEAIPDPSESYNRSITLLKRWQLVQSMLRHFWQRWSDEYLTSLARINKWHNPSRNIQVDDIVVIREENLVALKWPLARVIETHPGKDGRVRVVTLKTANGTYKRPITKVILLLPEHKDS